MHRLLQRQINSATSEDGGVDLKRLLELVSQAYDEADIDRRRTDRSITLMIDELDQANSEIRESQDRRFEAALSNMQHGLVMFDHDNRLLICNERYARLYELPLHLMQVGTSFWDIYAHRQRTGMTKDEPPTEQQARVQMMFDSKVPCTKTMTMLNGRVVRVHHQPLDDGGWLGTHEDITEQHRAEETIRFLARHDGLTGLANRVTFLEAMERAEKQIAEGKIMAVMCIDLDQFKPINDTQGHLAGDMVLKTVGERIRHKVGPRGLAARLGGDEFAALVGPIVEEAELSRLAKEMMSAIAAPMNVDGREVRISASIGIAVAPRDGEETDTLMRSGDRALYEAKTGRSGYCLFDRSMDERRLRRQTIEAGLRRAVDQSALRLHYQPLLSATDLSIISCEALMRWERAGEGPVSPAEFIPIAEETGQIREMGNWALREACRAATKWNDDVRISVNVSPVQFKDNDLLAHVGNALQASRLKPERLELEITESLFLEDDDCNLRTLHALRALGVRIVLDDFGTGYSALSYLRTFPFDAIKIDRSFILGVTERSDTKAIINAIMVLGTALGMDVTAEGIETEEQLALVQSQGCTAVQGFLFSPPLPELAMGMLLERRSAHVPLSKAS